MAGEISTGALSQLTALDSVLRQLERLLNSRLSPKELTYIRFAGAAQEACATLLARLGRVAELCALQDLVDAPVVDNTAVTGDVAPQRRVLSAGYQQQSR